MIAYNTYTKHVSLHSMGQELDAMESRLQQLRDTANEESALAAATRKVSDIQTVRLERKQEFERKRAGMIEAITEVFYHFM